MTNWQKHLQFLQKDFISLICTSIKQRLRTKQAKNMNSSHKKKMNFTYMNFICQTSKEQKIV